MNLIIQKEKQFRVSGDNVDTNKFLNDDYRIKIR